jgi:hypothetical protein
MSLEGPEAAQAESETTKKAADKRMRSFSMMRLLCWLRLPVGGVGAERGLYWPFHKLEYNHYNRF